MTMIQIDFATSAGKTKTTVEKIGLVSLFFQSLFLFTQKRLTV